MTNTKAQTANIQMATAGLQSLTGGQAVAVAYTILCDHKGVTAEDLTHLSNLLGRAAHEMERRCLS